MNMFMFIIVITVLFEIVTDFVPNVKGSTKTPYKCGLDKSPIKVVYEGNAKIETYPWIGILFYDSGVQVYSTPVVLVTRQLVIASALDIDRIPKNYFRSRTRVVLGHNCSRPGIKIKEYTYHPDFDTNTYSSVALIQLKTNFRAKDFHPICTPPKLLNKPQFYVLTLSDDCHNSKLKIYKMAYTPQDECRAYYSRTGLDMEKMWPTSTICARAVSGKKCIWKNGAILLLRQNYKWSLVGLGVQGPGCRVPSRFMDYARQGLWVKKTVAAIGRPTVTRISDTHLILRRSHSNVQRFGPCDLEEMRDEIYTDRTTIHRYPTTKRQRASYNLTIFANMEYSCIVLRVFHYNYPDIIRDIPYINLHRWCMTQEPICSTLAYLQIDFNVIIWFKESVTYYVAVYGKEIKVIDMKKVMVRVNSFKKLVQVELKSKNKKKL